MKKYPELVLVFSGKRKAGKDYVTSLLCNRIGIETCSRIQISGPLKKQYAKDHNLDFERLLDSSEYKEKFRVDMIKWGEDKRSEDSGYFCRLATADEDLKKIWVITDARRKTDIDYFKENYKDKTYTLRVNADEVVRKSRGFEFTPGVDDAESECGLDNYAKWNFVINNNGNQEQLDSDIDSVIDLIQRNIKDIT